jgi:amino acid adenylation domain-containing protein
MKNVEDYYPLSAMQQGMLFHSLSAPGSGMYHEQVSVSLHGELDVAAFSRAWEQVVKRHPALRTSFVAQDLDEPIQVVCREVSLPWDQQDWRGLSPEQQSERFSAYLQTDREQGLNLFDPPVMRFAIFRIADDLHKFLWTYHHSLLDGWSVSLVLKEVYGFYEAFRQGQHLDIEPRRPFRDYIKWLRQLDLSEAEHFWRGKLKGFTAPTPLPVDQIHVKPSDERKDYESLTIKLSAATTGLLQSFVRQHHLTLNTVVQGGWAMLLSRHCGEEDIVFGATVAGRPAALETVETMIGAFINTVPVRVQVSASDLLLPWLKQLQSQFAELRKHDHASLVKVQGWSEVHRGLFETLLVFENFPMSGLVQEQNGSLKISEGAYYTRINYPLTLMVVPDQEMCLRIMYDCKRFDGNAITRLLDHYRALLEGIVADPDRRLCEFPILPEAERRQLLVEWNDTARDYAKDQSIYQLFEGQAQRTPDAVAVVFADNELTYRELNRRSNQLAHYLIKLGVGPDVLVGICAERSIEMVVGLLGILKAGGAYMPLDPGYPKERLAFMLQDAQVAVLLTQAQLLKALPEHRAHVFCLDRDWEVLTSESTENPVSTVNGENLAYVIYTSGSTGQPKGAMNTHKGIYNRLLWMQEAYRLTEADRVLQKTPFSFDVSVWEFFWPLLAGARLVVARPEGHKDSAYLVKLINEQKITTLHFVPSMLQVFLDEPGVENCSFLKRVICSGEALTVALQERFFAKLGAELHNLYGPTEAAVDVTYWPCERESAWATVPIGRPIANTQIYILDPHSQPVPIGVPGELHIGGIGLARGYLNRPELTNEKFIPDPFGNESEARLYKTGDLARYLPDGNIEYLGRIDHQVKLRGFRIELGEIESVLSRHPSVRDTVVLAREDTPGEKCLAAYVVPAQEATPTPSDLRRFLHHKLPEYMVPSVFVSLQSLPLSPNGKVDRKALPPPDANASIVKETFVPPRTLTEKTLAKIWAEVLKVEHIGVHDHFFDIGGHSLLLAQVHRKLRGMFDRELSLVDLFEHPTIAALARHLNRDEARDRCIEDGGDTNAKLQAGISRIAELHRRRQKSAN